MGHAAALVRSGPSWRFLAQPPRPPPLCVQEACAQAGEAAAAPAADAPTPMAPSHRRKNSSGMPPPDTGRDTGSSSRGVPAVRDESAEGLAIAVLRALAVLVAARPTHPELGTRSGVAALLLRGLLPPAASPATSPTRSQAGQSSQEAARPPPASPAHAPLRVGGVRLGLAAQLWCLAGLGALALSAEANALQLVEAGGLVGLLNQVGKGRRGGRGAGITLGKG